MYVYAELGYIHTANLYDVTITNKITSESFNSSESRWNSQRTQKSVVLQDFKDYTLHWHFPFTLIAVV